MEGQALEMVREGGRERQGSGNHPPDPHVLPRERGFGKYVRSDVLVVLNPHVYGNGIIRLKTCHSTL